MSNPGGPNRTLDPCQSGNKVHQSRPVGRVRKARQREAPHISRLHELSVARRCGQRGVKTGVADRFEFARARPSRGITKERNASVGLLAEAPVSLLNFPSTGVRWCLVENPVGHRVWPVRHPPRGSHPPDLVPGNGGVLGRRGLRQLDIQLTAELRDQRIALRGIDSLLRMSEVVAYAIALLDGGPVRGVRAPIVEME